MAALAKTLSQQLALYSWNSDMSEPEDINVPNIYIHDWAYLTFLDYYLSEIEPTKREFVQAYRAYRILLEETMSKPGNEKLRLVLETWADWRKLKSDQNAQQGQDSNQGRVLIPYGPVEEDVA